MQKYKMILVVLVIGVMPLLILKNPQGQPLLIAVFGNGQRNYAP